MKRTLTPVRVTYGPYALEVIPLLGPMKRHSDVKLFWKSRQCGPLDIPALADFGVYWTPNGFGPDSEARSLSNTILENLKEKLAAMATELEALNAK